MRIDSLTKFKELVAGGMQEAQAECLAHGLAQASEIDMSNIATKDDLKHLEIATKADLKHLEIATRADIKHLEKVMYLFGALIAPCLGYLMFVK